MKATEMTPELREKEIEVHKGLIEYIALLRENTDYPVPEEGQITVCMVNTYFEHEDTVIHIQLMIEPFSTSKMANQVPFAKWKTTIHEIAGRLWDKANVFLSLISPEVIRLVNQDFAEDEERSHSKYIH